MICLDNTDTLEAGASVDAVVDYTVHGLVGTTFTMLADGKLSDTDPSVIYTAGAAISIVSVIFVNTHTSAVTCNLYLDSANGGNPRRLIPKDVSLGIGYSLHFDGQRISIMDTTGGIAYSYITHTHDTETLQLDGVNSNGGAFAFTTTGDVTFAHNLISADGKYVKIDKIRAIDGDGLLLEDDGGNGIEVVDGGTIHMAMQSGCSVYLSGDQDIPQNTHTLIEFDSEEDDLQGEFHVGNYFFTAAAAGVYQVSLTVSLSEGIADGAQYYIDIYKNDGVWARNRIRTGAAGTSEVGVSLRMPLSANDTIKSYVEITHTEPRLINSNLCRLTIAKIA